MSAVSNRDRLRLRTIAEKQRSYASLPIMAEREALWYLHNALQGPRSMIVMEEDTFLEEIMPPFLCETPETRWLEWSLLRNTLPHELFDDDKVVAPYFKIPVQIDSIPWGQKLDITIAKEGLGYHVEPLLTHLEDGFSILKPTEYSYNSEKTKAQQALAEDIFGDILPTRLVNERNAWNGSLAKKAVDIMGMENLLLAIMDTPDVFQDLMKFLTDDLIRELRWQEQKGLVFSNNGNDYMGSGSFCFNRELTNAGKPVRTVDTWGHINSQETVGISPAMYHEFFFPHFHRLSQEFGLLYYGCCEPVDAFWDSVKQYANLRKVSISPWCNEEKMADNLSQSSVIYSRKPSPNFLGINKELNEDDFRKSIKKTHALTKGACKTEYIFRDIYKLHGNIDKLKRAVAITRQVSEY